MKLFESSFNKLIHFFYYLRTLDLFISSICTDIHCPLIRGHLRIYYYKYHLFLLIQGHLQTYKMKQFESSFNKLNHFSII